MKAQLPRYQRLIPRPGQAHAAAPPVAAVGSIMPPQQGMPPQQPGMRHPMHGKRMLVRKSVCVKYPSDGLFWVCELSSVPLLSQSYQIVASSQYVSFLWKFSFFPEKTVILFYQWFPNLLKPWHSKGFFFIYLLASNDAQLSHSSSWPSLNIKYSNISPACGSTTDATFPPIAPNSTG